MIIISLLLGVCLFVAGSFAPTCQTFYTGMCPGDANCLCTLGASCKVSNETVPKILKLGGCGGSCREVTHGQCPGATSCLDNTGACGGGGGCTSCGSPCACCQKPANGIYYLTSFDGTSCSCGSCHQYGNYFTADRQRFGCGTTLHVCRAGKCVTARVTDYGPSCFVENDAGGAVLDSSPGVCQALTGASSCGWSDHFAVTVAVGDPNSPLGPWEIDDEDKFNQMIEEGKYWERVLGIPRDPFSERN